MTNRPCGPKGRGQGDVTNFGILYPIINIFGTAKAEISNFARVAMSTRSTNLRMTNCPPSRDRGQLNLGYRTETETKNRKEKN